MNVVNSYSRFSQIRTEIRGSKNYLIVGVDIAKSKHYAFFGTATGKTLHKKLVFNNSIEGFRKLINKTEFIQINHRLNEVVFGVEPTGNYHKPLGHYLIQSGYNLVFVSSRAVKKNRELLDGRWDKNDAKCAANVADLISQGKCLFYQPPTKGIDDLRSLLSLRKRYKKDEHRIRMRIRNNLLTKHFPELDTYFGNGGKETLFLVKHYIDPKRIASMEFEQFFKASITTPRGIAQKKRLESIWKAASNSVGLPVSLSAEFEAKKLVDQLQYQRENIVKIDKEIHKISLSFPEYKYLLTIPGFGPYISSMVLAKIGNPNRFKSSKQVIKLSGFDLNANRSGLKSQAAIPVISKRGASDLRYALYQASVIASYSDSYLSGYFINCLKGRENEKGIKTKMRVKLAVKLLVTAWAMMKNREAFRPELFSSL